MSKKVTRSTVATLALSLGLFAAPASAQAPIDPFSQHLCYSWLSLPPKEIAKRVHADVKDASLGSGAFRRASADILKCLQGAAEAIQPQVRDVCLAGAAVPDALIGQRMENALAICLAQAVDGPPVEVLTEEFPVRGLLGAARKR